MLKSTEEEGGSPMNQQNRDDEKVVMEKLVTSKESTNYDVDGDDTAAKITRKQRKWKSDPIRPSKLAAGFGAAVAKRLTRFSVGTVSPPGSSPKARSQSGVRKGMVKKQMVADKVDRKIRQSKARRQVTKEQQEQQQHFEEKEEKEMAGHNEIEVEVDVDDQEIVWQPSFSMSEDVDEYHDANPEILDGAPKSSSFATTSTTGTSSSMLFKHEEPSSEIPIPSSPTTSSPSTSSPSSPLRSQIRQQHPSKLEDEGCVASRISLPKATPLPLDGDDDDSSSSSRKNDDDDDDFAFIYMQPTSLASEDDDDVWVGPPKDNNRTESVQDLHTYDTTKLVTAVSSPKQQKKKESPFGVPSQIKNVNRNLATIAIGSSELSINTDDSVQDGCDCEANRTRDRKHQTVPTKRENEKDGQQQRHDAAEEEFALLHWGIHEPTPPTSMVSQETSEESSNAPMIHLDLDNSCISELSINSSDFRHNDRQIARSPHASNSRLGSFQLPSITESSSTFHYQGGYIMDTRNQDKQDDDEAGQIGALPSSLGSAKDELQLTYRASTGSLGPCSVDINSEPIIDKDKDKQFLTTEPSSTPLATISDTVAGEPTLIELAKSKISRESLLTNNQEMDPKTKYAVQGDSMVNQKVPNYSLKGEGGDSVSDYSDDDDDSTDAEFKLKYWMPPASMTPPTSCEFSKK